MALPECFCWTRFGTEAAQSIEQILARKEQERVANDGVFFWGIGNALGPSMNELLRCCREPEVLFSPIKSAARLQDVAPAAVAAWVSGETLAGDEFRLPERSLITSRHNPDAPRAAHYALVCYSEEPLTARSPRPGEKLSFRSLSNLRTGRPIGASQVTAVVRRDEGDLSGATVYEVAIRAKLVYPHFIRLRNPVVLAGGKEGNDLADVVRLVWDQQIALKPSPTSLRLPF
jgi:hypothetical protein